MPNKQLKERKTMDWVEIGFQGKDPATDFRGAGILGLEQLLYITDEGSVYRNAALKMFKDSGDPKNWYFFAVAGLNVTAKLLVSLQENPIIAETILNNFELVKEYHNFRKS